MTKCLTFPLLLPWYFISLWMPQLKVGEELELILKPLPETREHCMWLASSSWWQDWAPSLLGPSGLWRPLMERGEDAQMKNSEMLLFMTETDNSREEENVIIIIVLFQRQRELWRDRRIRVWDLGKMASAFCSAFMCDVGQDIYFSSVPSEARPTALHPLTWRIGRDREWGYNHSVNVRSLFIVMET